MAREVEGEGSQAVKQTWMVEMDSKNRPPRPWCRCRCPCPLRMSPRTWPSSRKRSSGTRVAPCRAMMPLASVSAENSTLATLGFDGATARQGQAWAAQERGSGCALHPEPLLMCVVPRTTFELAWFDVDWIKPIDLHASLPHLVSTNTTTKEMPDMPSSVSRSLQQRGMAGCIGWWTCGYS